MTARNWLLLSLTAALFVPSLSWSLALACCPAPPSGKPVVNADQTVIIIWDAASQTEHFIRQASFKSEASDFGFLVPTPNQPELEESGNDAFAFLLHLTEPEKRQLPRPSGGVSCIGCAPAASAPLPVKAAVKVLETKLVAGFEAAVLETKSADALVHWLKDHGYAFSPEVEAWAKPYVENGWKITALKVAKDEDGKDKQSVTASSLRISFKTDRPLFPYREPDSANSAAALGAKDRLLRIYFLAEARYQGELTKEVAWKSTVVWADKLGPQDRKKLLEMLKLSENTGPTEWQLTEFEHHWPYAVAPADVVFSRSADQGRVKRPPIIEYVFCPLPADATMYAIGAFLVLPTLWRRTRRGQKEEGGQAKPQQPHA
jgi:Uncharacterized protein conserved in bacteria (DUF2330)